VLRRRVLTDYSLVESTEFCNQILGVWQNFLWKTVGPSYESYVTENQIAPRIQL